LAYRIAVFDFQRTLAVDIVGMVGKVGVGEIVAQRRTGVTLAAELLRLGYTQFQAWQRTDRQMSTTIADIGLYLRAVQCAQKEFNLPGP